MKKRNIQIIGKAVLLSLLLLMILSGPAAAKEWTVGGPEADFPSLTDALAAAADNDLILIRAGTYETAANISIGKTVTIEGENKETVILELGGFSILPKKENFVLRNVTLKNGSNGINLQGNAVNAIIENCIFDGLTHKDGIKLAKDGAVFKDNVVKNMSGFTNAVYITGNHVRMVGNTLEGLSGNGNAARIVCIENAQDVCIEENHIRNNAAEAIRLWKAGTANAVITKNTIAENSQKGIYFYNAGENNTVYFNDIYGNAGGNIAAFGTVPQTAAFNSPESQNLVYNGVSWTGKPGNYWGDDYEGADTSGNGIGSTPKTVLEKFADAYPLVASFTEYKPDVDDPDKPLPKPGKSSSSISMTTNILPSVSVSFSIDSLDFGDLAPGQIGGPKEMEITNSGGCDVRVTAEVTESSDKLYQKGIWIDDTFWPDFEAVVQKESAQTLDVVLKVPADYENTGIANGTLIMWVQAC